MGHHIPFDWSARKRRGSGGQSTDTNAYDQCFRDDDDFPGFPSHWADTFNRTGSGRKRNPPTINESMPDRSGFFDYLPPEFRQYIPESFSGFTHHRRPPPSMARSPPSTSGTPQKQHQVYTVQPEPTTPTRCDAAIQTEDLSHETGPVPQTGLHQHGLRNTVDFGQKSQSENVQTDRSHSAPPAEVGSQYKQTQQPISAASADFRNDGQFNSFGTSTMPKDFVDGQQRFHYQQPKDFQPSHWQQEQQIRQQQNQKSQQQQFPKSENNVRTVPIFVEGSDKPVVSKTVFIPPKTDTQSEEEPIKQQKSYQQPQPQQGQQNQPQPTTHSQHQHQYQSRPEPFNQEMTNDALHSTDVPQTPQTPQTSDCILKIQAIQRDVLDLMGRVERFTGTRKNKEYIQLDELLTVNLLKLDTIDTNGKDRIRLARKEAIKCIQASIAVLEAKAEEKIAKEQQQEQKLEQQQNKDDNCKITNEEIVNMDTTESNEIIVEKNDDQKENDNEISMESEQNEVVSIETDGQKSTVGNGVKHLSELKINITGDQTNTDDASKYNNPEETHEEKN